MHQDVLRQPWHQHPCIEPRRVILPNRRHLHDPLKQTFPTKNLLQSVEGQLPAPLRVVRWTTWL